MSASRRPVTGSGKRALVALAMGAITSPLLIGFGAGPASAAVDLTTACPQDQVEDPGFTDIGGVPEQFRVAINCLATLGITTGQTSTTFNPAGSITRVQMAQFLFRLGEAAGLEWDTTDSGFTDIAGVSAEGQQAINALFNAGVVNGKTETTFDPLSSVTRGQMATFIAQFYENVLGAPLPGEVQDAFEDDDNSVHEQNINAVAAADIADGFSAEMYGPDRPVTRGQMAAFVARTIQVAINEELIPPLFEQPAPEPTVTVDNEGNVTAGGDLTGTFADLPEGATVMVSGAGLTNQAVTVDANGAFTLALPANAPTGAQTLTFTVTVGDETFEVTADITVAAQPSTTARPDLMTSTVVSTVAPGQATPTSPAGTTIRYTFDENVNVVGGATVGGAATGFRARLSDGTALTGQVFAATTATTVDVLFPSVTTTTGAGSAEDITLATVAFNAVTDASGLANPEYDAPLGTAAGGAITLPAGVTTAPDLVGVAGFRQAANAGETAVDFTFDEPAFVTGAGQFTLVLTDGSTVNATSAPAVGTGTTPSGGTIAGGNGTTTITVIVPSPTSTQTPRPPLAASAVARAVVAGGTVADLQQFDNDPAAPGFEAIEGVANPLQAAQGTGGDTVEPDLVSVQLQPSTTAGGTDRVLFTFDEAVATVDVTDFGLYTATGASVGVTNPQINPSNRAQVLVDVAAGSTLADVVGGTAAAGAVATAAVAETPTTPAQPARANEADEEGVPNTGTETGRTPGRTALPDLVGVAINQAAADQFGNPGQFQATYTFDEDVADAPGAAATTPAAGNFFLYLGDGTRLQGTTLSSAARTEDTDNTVTITGYQVLLVSGAVRANDPNTAVNESLATQAEIQAAVLGTVGLNAVTVQGGTLTNPIGAERTTGGSGALQ